MIVVVDYGAENLRSVANACGAIGQTAWKTCTDTGWRSHGLSR